MTDEKTITEAQLNAFVDNELDDNEQVEILNLINENPELLQTANEIRHDMDMVALAYRNLPVKNSIVKLSDRKGVTPIRYAAMAAGVFLALGVISGWLVSSYTEQSSRPVFTTVDNFKPETSRAEKILIHVSTRDGNRVSRALNKLEEILEASEDSQNHVQLKFVANAEGLAVLREDSPYADRIKFLSEQYDNVEFLACGIAMKTAQLKEKEEIVLLPEAKKISAALSEILERLEAGWTYMGS